MRSFSFLHAADIHLDSPFVGLAAKSREAAETFSRASRAAFESLIDRALEEQVAFAIIAGDLYDGDWRDVSTGLFFIRTVAKLARAGIPVFLLRGNHDAESEITRQLPLPQNVQMFSTRRPQTFELPALQVALHGRSFPERQVSDNYARTYPAPRAGWFNIGVLHTLLAGREGHESYAPCDLSDLQGRGYDYWALGHVHAYEVVAERPHVVFPGNLQGRSIRETGPKGAAIVRVVDGAVAAVERAIVDAARWASVTVPLDGVETTDKACERIGLALDRALGAADGRSLAVRVTLTGATPLHGRLLAEPVRAEEEVQAAAAAAGDNIWLERVRIATSPPARHANGRDAHALAEIVRLLEEVAADPAVRQRLAGEIRDMRRKVTGETRAPDLPLPGDDLDPLLQEATAAAIGRLLGVAGGGAP